MDIKVWYLSTCSTCQRIIKEASLDADHVRLIDIKSQPVTENELEDMYHATGSFKDLINGRSTKFRTMDKKANELSEDEARNLLLQHYAFLKRPVVRVDQQYFVGNSKKVVEALKSRLNHG